MKSFRDAHQQRGTMSESKFSQFTYSRRLYLAATERFSRINHYRFLCVIVDESAILNQSARLFSLGYSYNWCRFYHLKMY